MANDADGAVVTNACCTPLGVTSLDTIVPALGIQHIDLLKIDTEGAEVAVLQGGRTTLELVDRIVLEYHSQDLRRQVEALLEQARFTVALASDIVSTTGIIYARKRLQTGNTGALVSARDTRQRSGNAAATAWEC